EISPFPGQEGSLTVTSSAGSSWPIDSKMMKKQLIKNKNNPGEISFNRFSCIVKLIKALFTLSPLFGKSLE
ncbi:MAG: hypothetical protein R6V72_05450, partial [Cyclobacterium sp.]|uniref:hypothetical protein n=1 Tax=Cyclobacterium sp. TaxID=1966343 RepID=UPI003970EE5C